ncbi:MAG: hypothetical protein BJ554DRAFT_5344, partial [Olpidium bornovanus]
MLGHAHDAGGEGVGARFEPGEEKGDRLVGDVLLRELVRVEEVVHEVLPAFGLIRRAAPLFLLQDGSHRAHDGVPGRLHGRRGAAREGPQRLRDVQAPSHHPEDAVVGLELVVHRRRGPERAPVPAVARGERPDAAEAVGEDDVAQDVQGGARGGNADVDDGGVAARGRGDRVGEGGPLVDEFVADEIRRLRGVGEVGRPEARLEGFPMRLPEVVAARTE